MHRCLILALSLCFSNATWANAHSHSKSKPFSVQEMVQLKRVSDPRLSADGKSLMYALRETDMAANKGQSALWLAKNDGTEARKLTGFGASSGRFSADSKWIYFLSSDSGSSQLWRIARSDGKATQVSQLPLDIGSFVLAPNGRHVAFSLAIFPDCAADLKCTKDRQEANGKVATTGVLQEGLFIRHWDTWRDGTQNQLFVADLADTLGTPRLLSQGIGGDVPSKPFGDDSEYAFSPDSKTVVFSARIAYKSEPWSTNFDLYSVPSDASAKTIALNRDNPAWDTTPVFSPDGKTLYYRAMTRPGFEADRFRILARELVSGKTREIAPKWDRSPDTLAITADGKTLLTHNDDIGQRPLFAIDVKSGAVRNLSGAGTVGGFSIQGKTVVFARDDLSRPADLYRLPLSGGKASQITNVNADALGSIAFGETEQFSFKGWNDQTVYAWMVKPVGFDPSKRYPVAYLIHGGPQGSFGNQFHYRWNPQTYAAQGWVTVMVDFHGSTGYGQAFTDSISGDWGGKPLVDLQKGMETLAARYAFADTQRACALGGSYGGYMTNWIAGAWPDGFKCLVTHAGIFDKRFMAYSTEELWFTEWENGGVPWQKAKEMEVDNPVTKVDQWKTPMLVIHGQLDFRVPFEQGIAAFTALQRRGVDSQFLSYPNENHWILKPQNSVQWHETVNRWLHKHLGTTAKHP